MNVEGLTNSEGKCEYTTDGRGDYTLHVSRDGYVPYVKDMCVSKNSLANIIVPLIPTVQAAPDRTTVEICISGDAACKDLSLVLFCPFGNERLDGTHAESERNKARIVDSKAGKVAIITSGLNEWYRVGVVIKDPKLTTLDKKGLDQYVQNPLQSLNVIVHVVANNEVRYTIYPPACLAGEFWDLGFVNALNGEMMVVNALTCVVPDNRVELCAEFFAFYGYMAGQGANCKAAFGMWIGVIRRI